MSFGWQNPFPFQLGGGETDAEVYWRGMRAAVGGERGPGPIGGFEDSWRQIKAVMIASSEATIDRAFLEGIPGAQVWSLDAWEQILDLPALPTLAERQAALRAALTLRISFDYPAMQSAVQAIDPKFTIVLWAWEMLETTQFGRTLGPRDGSLPVYSSGLATRTATAYPNISGAFVVHVGYMLGPGETVVPPEKRAILERYLATLPAWLDWQIETEAGFLLDGGPDGTSLMDLTPFGA